MAFAELLKRLVFRGKTCALRRAASYTLELLARSLVTLMEGSPPWQSAQPIATVPPGCIDGSSVFVWQVMQPALCFAAFSGDCCETRDCPTIASGMADSGGP